MAIPITAAKRVAKEYNYDQIIIIGRRVGEGGHEHVTTYGKTKDHCKVAARSGDYIKYEVMGWPKPEKPAPKCPECLDSGKVMGFPQDQPCRCQFKKEGTNVS